MLEETTILSKSYNNVRLNFPTFKIVRFHRKNPLSLQRKYSIIIELILVYHQPTTASSNNENITYLCHESA